MRTRHPLARLGVLFVLMFAAAPTRATSYPEYPPSPVSRIRARLARIQRCYAQVLARDPTIGGKLKLAVVMAPDGRVREAKVAPEGTTLTDVGLGGCVVAVIRTIRFDPPPSADEAEMAVSFELHPSD